MKRKGREVEKFSQVNNIKEIRTAKRYTIKELSAKSGIPFPTIVALENDAYNIYEIKLSTLNKLCVALETTPYRLFKDDEIKQCMLHFSKKNYTKKIR